MPEKKPEIFLRIGSHSEKDYFEKLLHLMDGFIIASNLIEATPAASASLVFKFSGELQNTPYLLDPMTYAFGAYVDPKTKAVRKDLDWIKSFQKRDGEQVRDFKRSYSSLSTELGDPFESSVKNSKAILPSSFSDPKLLSDTCSRVAEYQINRIRNVFEMDEETAAFAGEIPEPIAVFAPYFYVEPSDARAWLDVNMNLAETTVKLGLNQPVHSILCADHSFLADSDFVDSLIRRIIGTGVSGIWLWFSRLDEENAPVNNVNESEDYLKLRSLRRLTETLSDRISVNNMHGGFFSLALSKFGMKAISHGVGYGEQKDVVPVVGKATPMVRYYHPKIHKRLGVPDIERCFRALGINSPEDFFTHICDCIICRGIIKNDISQFSKFGEFNPPRLGKTRSSQTPAAAKRCRFHFLLSRINERGFVSNSSIAEIRQFLDDAFARWGAQPAIARFCHHLKLWYEVLS